MIAPAKRPVIHQVGNLKQYDLSFTPVVGTWVLYLCRHDEAGCGGVDGDVASHQTDVLELFVHFSVLLVGQGLDGAGEDHPLLLSQCQRYSVPAGRGPRRLHGWRQQV